MKKRNDADKLCFVICPLGDDRSGTRRKSDGLLKSVVKPTLETLDYKVVAPHEIDATGSITNHIMEHILNDDLVIANLTELNPNVMYELAVRHATGKPVICLIENGTKIPFDIAQERAIFYENDMHGVEEVKPKLQKMVEQISHDPKHNLDNPIYRAKKQFKLQEITVEGSTERILLDKLEELAQDIGKLKRNNLPLSSYERGVSRLYRFIFQSNSKDDHAKILRIIRQSRIWDFYTESIDEGIIISISGNPEDINALSVKLDSGGFNHAIN